IHEIEVVDVSPGPYPEAEIVVRCGSGTYIRTLADDLAQALGGRAHLTALRRTAIGLHDVGRALTIEALDALDEPATALLSMADGLGELGSAVVDEDTASGVSNGVIFAAAAFGASEPGSFRVLGEDGALLAVYSSDGKIARPQVVVA
ncbi:MAG: tRNA pseudouridine(55) synthase TruB, partial [Acidimicrobiia bacterium]